MCVLQERGFCLVSSLLYTGSFGYNTCKAWPIMNISAIFGGCSNEQFEYGSCRYESWVYSDYIFYCRDTECHTHIHISKSQTESKILLQDHWTLGVNEFRWEHHLFIFLDFSLKVCISFSYEYKTQTMKVVFVIIQNS